MTNVLPYHEDRDDLVLSLRFVCTSERKAESVVEDIEQRAAPDVRVETSTERYSFDEPFYAVYAARSHPRTFPDRWDEDLSDDEVVLVDSVINTFRGVQQEWERRGKPLNYYKEPNPGRIVEAFDDVEWCQSVPTVGGELMSSLILKHALPNANHRTAVAYLRTYLQSFLADGNVEFRHAGNYEGDWHEWARAHVFESKRLLMIRRRPDLLRHAKRLGVETVRRKSGIEVDLTAQEFEDGSIRRMAEEGHRNRCVQFAKEILERSSLDHLISSQDDGRRAFVDRLR